MRINPELIIETLEDGSALLLDPTAERVFLLNKTGREILQTANSLTKIDAEYNFFRTTKYFQGKENTNEYQHYIDLLIDHHILIEE